MRRHAGSLAMMLVILTAGFALTLTFFVGSTSVVTGLERFFDTYRQQSGSFVMDPTQAPPDEPGIVGHEAADVAVLDGESTLRVFSPRTELDVHEVVEGNDLGGPGEMLVNRLFAKEHGISPGDTLTAGGGDWEVVGFLATPDYVTVKSNQLVLQPNHEAFGIAMVSADDFTEQFGQQAYVTYAYDASHSAGDLAERFQPLDLRPTIDDSRVQIALTDAKGPRDLAFLVFVLFLAITAALLAVYHLRVRTADAVNSEVLRQAGLARGLARHQKTETRMLLLISWGLSCLVAVVLVRPVMNINGGLYDYPLIEVQWWFLAACAAVGLLSCLALDEAAHRMAHRRGGPARRGGAAPRWRGPTLDRLGWVPDFGYRYKLVRTLRKPGDTLAVVGLVLVVGLFTTFSLNLKWSVENWVDSLAPTTPYHRLYDVSALTEPLPAREGQELAAAATLYAHGSAQSVFLLPSDSSFVRDLDGVVVTRAFVDKYGTQPGDSLTLTDVGDRNTSSVTIDRVREEDTASALVYIPADDAETLLPDDTVTAPLLMSDHPDDRLEGVVPTVSREDVEQSGKSIIKVIDSQVSLLLVLAAMLLVVLFTAITTFTRDTQAQARRIMELEGVPPRSVRRSMFGGVTLLAVAAVVVAGLLSASVVRVFLDGIMGRFVNFVPVTATVPSVLVALVGVVVMMQVCIVLSGRGKGRRAQKSA